MTKIILHQFPSPKHIPNYSPFCMKLETFLRMAGIEYEVAAAVNPAKAPKGKMPFIEIDGKTLHDSSLIINRFQCQDKYNIDAELTDEQRAQALLLQRTCEEHLYWGIVYSRWQDPVGWQYWQKIMSSALPKLLSFLVYFIRKKALKELHAQGLGRLSTDEVYQLCQEDLTAIDTLFTAEDFFFGDKPTTIDACLFSFIGSILFTPWDFPLKTYLQKNVKIKGYYQRMIARFFPNYPSKPLA